MASSDVQSSVSLPILPIVDEPTPTPSVDVATPVVSEEKEKNEEKKKGRRGVRLSPEEAQKRAATKEEKKLVQLAKLQLRMKKWEMEDATRAAKGLKPMVRPQKKTKKGVNPLDQVPSGPSPPPKGKGKRGRTNWETTVDPSHKEETPEKKEKKGTTKKKDKEDKKKGRVDRSLKGESTFDPKSVDYESTSMSKDMKVGDIYSRVEYFEFRGVAADRETWSFKVMRGPESGKEWNVHSPDSNPYACVSSSEFTRVIKLSKTEILNIFLHSVKQEAITVTFKTNFDEARLVEHLIGRALDCKTEAEAKGVAKEMMQEQERTFVCRKVPAEANRDLGYSLVDVLEAEGKPTYRQINHRSISELIWRGIKFVVK